MPAFQIIYDKHKEDIKKLIAVLSADTIEDRETSEYKEEYEGERKRRAKSVGLRENKTVNTYRYNENTDTYIKSGTKTMVTQKLAFPFPKIITRTAAHFCVGGEMRIEGEDGGEGLEVFKDVWFDSLKMQSLVKKSVRTCMSETKAAILFFPVPALIEGKKGLKLKAKILDYDAGEFYPHFDDYGDMDSFLYRFKALNEDGKPIERVKIHTSERVYEFYNDGGWIQEPVKPNLFGLIPVVYVEQDEPEWESVAPLMDDFEMRVSRLADTNDYFSEPLLKIFGNISKLPDKDDSGKVLNFEAKEHEGGKTTHGDADYLTWDHTPASIQLELDTIWKSIFFMSSTPELSPEALQGIGNLSGRAIQLLFMNSFIKRDEKMEIFGPMIQRCVSVVKAGIGNITNIKYKTQIEAEKIEVEFTDILPTDYAELITTLVQAAGGKPILSQESAARQSPYTKDANKEVELLKQQNSEDGIINESFNM